MTLSENILYISLYASVASDLADLKGRDGRSKSNIPRLLGRTAFLGDGL